MNWKVRFSDFPSQFRKLESQAMGTIHKVLSCGSISPGKHLDQFEAALADFTATSHAVAVSSCHDAMELALEACGIGAGDEVITVPRGFPGTVDAIERRGAKVVFVKQDDNQLMEAEKVMAAITAQTKAILPVHLNGHVCDMNYIRLVARKHDCLIIEDASQALAASCNGNPVGSQGHVAFFDFGPDSLIGGYGSGGGVVSGDDEIGKRLQPLRDSGQPGGICRHLDNLQAAVLDLKLKHLPDDILRRRELAEMYHRAFRGLDGLKTPPEPTSDGKRYDVFHAYEIQSEYRDELAEYLSSCGIDHVLPANCTTGNTLWLPIQPELTADNVQLVAQCVAKLHQDKSKRGQAA